MPRDLDDVRADNRMQGRFFRQLLDEAIRPNATALAEILTEGNVALVFFEVGERSPLSNEFYSTDTAATSKAAARMLGWRGERVEVSRMNKTRAAKLGDDIARASPADPAVAWLRSRRRGRIFVCAHTGTLCVNYAEGEGFTIEPGTLDAEWKS